MDPIDQDSTYVGDPDGAAPAPAARVRGRKRRRGIAILPSLFTLGNCLCGFASLNYAARGIPSGPEEITFASNYAIAGYFIFLAMAFDMFDGFVARLTRSASDFGAELDSLADMVSFGLAPAFLSIHLIGDLGPGGMLSNPGASLTLPGPFSDNAWQRLFWVIAAIYVCCTALRLARFNVINKHEVSSHMNFRGMPSPGAAAVVAATVIFFEMLRTEHHHLYFNVTDDVKKGLTQVFPYLLPVVLLIAALLMVSRFAYSHLINRFLRGPKKFRTLVGFLLLGMIVLFEPQLSAIVAIYLYALSAPIRWLVRKMLGKGPPGAPPGLPVVTKEG